MRTIIWVFAVRIWDKSLFSHVAHHMIVVFIYSFQPHRPKTTFRHLCPAKIQITLRIHGVWSGSSLCALLTDKDTSFGQRRLWSGAALRWVHMPEGTFLTLIRNYLFLISSRFRGCTFKAVSGITMHIFFNTRITLQSLNMARVLDCTKINQNVRAFPHVRVGVICVITAFKSIYFISQYILMSNGQLDTLAWGWAG